MHSLPVIHSGAALVLLVIVRQGREGETWGIYLEYCSLHTDNCTFYTVNCPLKCSLHNAHSALRLDGNTVSREEET